MVMPAMKRWKNRNTSSVGRLASRERAPCTPQATVYWPRRETMPSMMVRLSSLWVKISGHRKSFQIQVNCSVPRAGRLMGRATPVSTRHSLRR